MIIVRIWEGLGNQLFQYSFAKALQLNTGQRVYLDISEYTRDVIREYNLCNFKISLPVIKGGKQIFNSIDGRDFYNVLRADKDCSGYGFPMKFAKETNILFKPFLLNPSGNWYFKGWFQNEKYFAPYADIIRKELRPVNKIKIPSELKDILDKAETVSVHFRRTDFQGDHNILDLGYYRNAIRYIENKIKSPYYLVFSDDLEWVRQNVQFGSSCYFVNENRELRDCEELLVMSRCRHNIIANSTFSWWGAWLNDHAEKLVIAPGKWFLNQNKKTDIVPKEWIRI